MYNIPLDLTTNLSLIRIQQNQGAIGGYFIGSQANGLQVNEPFSGMIDAHEHIRFTVAEYAEQIMLSFDGSLQSDGCTGYLAHLFGKSYRKGERACLHSLHTDVQPG
jgi:hypothetical protein